VLQSDKPSEPFLLAQLLSVGYDASRDPLPNAHKKAKGEKKKKKSSSSSSSSSSSTAAPANKKRKATAAPSLDAVVDKSSKKSRVV